MKQNETEVLGEMPEFEYYDGLNHFLTNYYPYLTLFCQGFAYLFAITYHFTNYKSWNLLGTMIAALCLPVDILIFWIEPLGPIGTMAAMVLGFIPFTITVADAAYPEKEQYVAISTKKITKVYKNSWVRHFSLSYNERYNFLMRMTWSAYSFFATIALGIVLIQGNS